MTFSRIRSRKIDFIDRWWYNYVYEKTGLPSVKDVVMTTGAFTNYPVLLQHTSDSVHRNYPHEGGPFEMRKFQCKHTPALCFNGWDFYYKNKHYRSGYEGRAYALPSVPSIQLPSSQIDFVESKGAEAWNKFKPIQPYVSLGTFIAELRDVPGLLFKRVSKYRDLGNNYLAHQFGWKPFLGDLISWYDSVKKIDQRVAQLKRDNGRYVKRGGTLFRSSEFNRDTCSASQIDLGFPDIYRYDSVTQETWESEKCWFSARFKYYIPGLMSAKFGTLAAYRRLWGLKMTPNEVWQLLPWSWLVDWFSNVGDVISNLVSASDENLVAKYAYLMYHRKVVTKKKVNFTCRVQDGIASYSYVPDMSEVTTISETKTRTGASPFGFNLEIGGLSAYQSSILSALGISRLKF